MRPLILASASPRRREMLDRTGIPYEVDVSRRPEVIDRTLAIPQAIMDVARQKAADVVSRHPQALVLAADTIVTVDGAILGKPRDAAQCVAMLTALAGRTHQVVTGVALADADGQELFFDQADVTFSPIDRAAIAAYAATAEPYDKAGGYAIQGWAGLYITAIRGSYDTVMGLPLALVYGRLVARGYASGR